jgi:uncharacterized pyridoxal phosphate-containing UPF0001 family protein
LPDKHGVSQQQAVFLAKHIEEHCPSLVFRGLMTIGSVTQAALSENLDFERLLLCRKMIAQELEIETEDLELSMGMSSDFVQAVRNLIGPNSAKVKL